MSGGSISMSEDRGQRTEDGDQIGQSKKEFFTLRREGAKGASESKQLISSRNLSGLASLREIFLTQGRPAEEER
jgi:hypothetical protein